MVQKTNAVTADKTEKSNGIVNTADESDLAKWMLMCFAAGIGFVGFSIYLLKQKKS